MMLGMVRIFIAVIKRHRMGYTVPYIGYCLCNSNSKFVFRFEFKQTYDCVTCGCAIHHQEVITHIF